ncbi:MAG: N-methyl-L-tryptophan oxidase [Gemmatimonadota bacterium]|nr:N-methyl-L-tryptophan oxidase [Gemmatimonadota bacterium]
MTTPHSYDVIVVGLGAMGSATAAHLAERGRRVLGIDQFTPPHTMGSSHGESRIIRLAYFEHPLYVPLVRRAYDLWRRLERDADASGLLTVTGGLMLGSPTSGLIAGARRAAAEHGVTVEEIPNSSLQDRFPQFMPMPGFTGLLDPAAGFLNPDRCVKAHLQRAAANGATLRYDEPVLEWTPAGEGVRVRTTRGTYEAGRLVLAAGPWMPELLGAMGPMLSVERQTVVWFDPPGDPDMWSPDRFPIYMCEFDDGQLIYGFPLQPRGWKAAVHYEGEPVTEMRTVRRTVEPHDIARVRGAAARLFPWVAGAPVRDSACCFYTDTQDLRFVVDFLPGMPQVLVSSPCSGHGFKFASAIGELQAQLLLDGRADFDVAPFRIDR